MEKNSEFIKTKEFHVVFKGYSPDEVDKFLDIVSIEFERLIKKNRELQEGLDRVNFEDTAEEDSDIKKIIHDALISAHKVADEIKSQAKKEAEEMVVKIKQDEEKAFEDLKAKKAQMEESVLALQSRYEEFRDKVKNVIGDLSKFVAGSSIEHVFEAQAPEIEDKSLEEVSRDNIIDEGPETGELNDSDMSITREDGTGMVEAANEPEESAGTTIKEKDGKESPADDSGELEGFKSSHKQKSGSSRLAEEPPEGEKSEYPGKTDAAEAPGDLKTGKSDGVELKRDRKKIDIANPDIIENFFRTNND